MKANKYLSLAALAIAFAACTQDDLMPQGNQKDAPLAIATAGVAELATRATIDADNNLVDGSIGVYVTSNKGGRYAAENMQWTYSSSNGWESTGKLSFQNDSEQQKIAAYWPYQADVTGGITVTLPEEQTTDDLSNLDYLFAEYAGVATNPVEITMKHLLSKVTVDITTGNELDGDAIKSIEMVGMKNNALWTPPTGTLDFTNADSDASLSMATVDGNTYEALAIPDGSVSLALRIIMTSGRKFNATATLPTGGLAQSQHYTFNLDMGKDKVEVSNVSVKNWTDTPIGANGLESSEVKPSIDGTEYASLAELLEAVKTKLSGESTASVTITGYLSDEMHAAIISTISEIKTEGAVTNGYLLAGSVTYTVHSTFDEAVTAWKDGKNFNLTLLGNVTERTETIELTGTDLHLELNGHELTCTENEVINLKNGSNLTIRDNSGDGSISCSYPDQNYLERAVYVASGACLNLESGELKGVGISGNFIMTGGNIAWNDYDALSIYSGGNALISGGEVTSSMDAVRNYYGGHLVVTGTARIICLHNAGDCFLSINSDETATTIVTGSTFADDPSEWVDANKYTVNSTTDETGNTYWTVEKKTTETE